MIYWNAQRYDSLPFFFSPLNSPTQQLHALILINMGSISDLPDPVWFGDFSTKVTVHVIDSSRPRSLDNYFMRGENGERIVVWDDMDAETLVEEKEAWEILRVRLVKIPINANTNSLFPV